MKTRLTRLVVSAGLALLGMMVGCLLIIFFSTVVMLIVSLLPVHANDTEVAKWCTVICFAVAFAGITYGIYKNKP
jgi:hypothetical protein